MRRGVFLRLFVILVRVVILRSLRMVLILLCRVLPIWLLGVGSLFILAVLLVVMRIRLRWWGLFLRLRMV